MRDWPLAIPAFHSAIAHSKMMRVVACFLALLVSVASADAKTKRSRSKSKKSRSHVSRISVPSEPFSAVVIDAGHGGFDLGGIRQNIIQEKGVALDVALRLSRELRAAGMKTTLTRSTDTFVTLEKRVAVANAHPEAVFICVHFNSGLRVGARGVETFYSSGSAAALAARIQRNAMTTTNGDNRGVKRASFYVLRKARIRSVLVECGFLTNPQDAALARSASYRQKLAEQIAAAVVSYRDSFG